MKKSSIINRIATIVGLSLGAFALAAVAQVGTWNPAPASGPPNDNVPAPINAGSITQKKIGSLKVGLDDANNVLGGLSVGGLGILSSNFIYKPSVADVSIGSVLTSTDTLGTVAWQAPGSGGSGTVPKMQLFSSSGTWVAPAGVTSVNVEVWGAGSINKAGSYAFGRKTVVPGNSYTVTVGTSASGDRSVFWDGFAGSPIIAAGGNTSPGVSSGDFVINGNISHKNQGTGAIIVSASSPRGGSGAVIESVAQSSGYVTCSSAVVPGGAGLPQSAGCNAPSSTINGAAGRVIIWY